MYAACAGGSRGCPTSGRECDAPPPPLWFGVGVGGGTWNSECLPAMALRYVLVLWEQHGNHSAHGYSCISASSPSGPITYPSAAPITIAVLSCATRLQPSTKQWMLWTGARQIREVSFSTHTCIWGLGSVGSHAERGSEGYEAGSRSGFGDDQASRGTAEMRRRGRFGRGVTPHARHPSALVPDIGRGGPTRWRRRSPSGIGVTNQQQPVPRCWFPLRRASCVH